MNNLPPDAFVRLRIHLQFRPLSERHRRTDPPGYRRKPRDQAFGRPFDAAWRPEPAEAGSGEAIVSDSAEPTWAGPHDGRREAAEPTEASAEVAEPHTAETGAQASALEPATDAREGLYLRCGRRRGLEP